MAISEGIVVGLVMILVRNIWGYAYSNEVDGVKYVADMMPILAISNLIDGIQAVLSGKFGLQTHAYFSGFHNTNSVKQYTYRQFRGCGWQKIGAYVNLGSYYLVGIPSALLFAFVLYINGKVSLCSLSY